MLQVPNFQRARLRTGAYKVFRLTEAYAFYGSSVATQALKKRHMNYNFNKFEFNNNNQEV